MNSDIRLQLKLIKETVKYLSACQLIDKDIFRSPRYTSYKTAGFSSNAEVDQFAQKAYERFQDRKVIISMLLDKSLELRGFAPVRTHKYKEYDSKYYQQDCAAQVLDSLELAR